MKKSIFPLYISNSLLWLIMSLFSPITDYTNQDKYFGTLILQLLYIHVQNGHLLCIYSRLGQLYLGYNHAFYDQPCHNHNKFQCYYDNSLPYDLYFYRCSIGRLLNLYHFLHFHIPVHSDHFHHICSSSLHSDDFRVALDNLA